MPGETRLTQKPSHVDTRPKRHRRVRVRDDFRRVAVDYAVDFRKASVDLAVDEALEVAAGRVRVDR